MPKVGILGSLVWDQIYGRDPLAEPVEEWGGVAYALASLDASVAPGWEIVPLIKVGQDLSVAYPGQPQVESSPWPAFGSLPIRDDQQVLAVG